MLLILTDGRVPAADIRTVTLDGLTELVEAEVLLVAETLRPGRAAVRIGHGEGLTGASLAGFLLIHVGSLAEAVAWARRLPKRPGVHVEVRPVVDALGLEFTPERLRVA